MPETLLPAESVSVAIADRNVIISDVDASASPSASASSIGTSSGTASRMRFSSGFNFRPSSIFSLAALRQSWISGFSDFRDFSRIC